LRHLRLYRAIQLIVRTGSIRKASEYLAISPSALNRSIQAFEEELGIDIFDRVAGGVRLSVPGELLFRPMIEHLAEMDDFSFLLSEMRGGTAGALRLSVSGDLLGDIVEPVVADYRERYPKVAVEVMQDETISPLSARMVDLAISSLPQTDDGVSVVLSHKVGLVGRVAPGGPSPERKMGLSDIPDHCLIVPPIGSGVRAAIDVALRRRGVAPAARMICPTPVVVLRAGPVPDLQVVVASGRPDPHGARLVDLGGLRLGDVQITVMQRSEGTLPRAASQLLAILSGALDALDGPSDPSSGI